MLKTINLCKTYRPKKGVPVKALDCINLQFPDKGMVFILGKSGSGKSTLLNVLGGLDSYNSGEIVIKGTSSKDFKQRDFDSYRNTYIGFIFQEYNILDEFTVGANIALAIELQSRKATSEEINKILKQVDLEGYGNRKPNELSGGQKQRVAIARALVKNPEIIMADEPTGALDSNTGKQVFDTLKELSKEKLVIIVSHDREFSEQYADRIIELADGKIISDVEKEDVNETAKENNLVFENGEITVPEKYVLTDKDLEDINTYLTDINKEVKIKSRKVVKEYTFKETDTKNIKVSDSNNFKLIKSKLPIKSAAKIGCSSLKHKPFRLIVTILLSVVSFTLFGLTDTIASFNKIDSAVNSIIDSKVNYVSFNRLKKEGSDDYIYWNNGGNLTEEERLSIQNEVDVDLIGVFRYNTFGNGFKRNFKEQKINNQFFSYTPSNFYNLTENNMKKMGYNLLKGELPKKEDEIAITKLQYMYFKEFGYKYISKDNLEPQIEIEANDVTLDNIVGKKINLMSEENIYLDFTITGIVDTGLNEKRYEILKKDALTDKDMLNFWLINSEYTNLLENGLDFAFILSESGLKFIQDKNTELNSINGSSFEINFKKDYDARIEIFKNIDNVEDLFKNNIKYFDNQKESLSDTSNQVVVGKNILNSIIAKDYQEKELDNEDKLVNSNIRISVTNLSEYIENINNINVWKYVLAHSEEVNDFIEENNLGSVLENYNEYYYNNRYSYIAEENEVIENVKSDYIRIINKYIGNSIPIEVYIRNYNLSFYENNVSLEIVGVCEDYSYLENEYTNYFNTVIYGKSVSEYYQENTYSMLVGAMPSSASEIRKIVKFNYKEVDGIRYGLNNPAMDTVNMLSDTLESMAKIFLYVGLGLMVFAIVMLSNFIVVSISYKKVEIGILRAIGSRSNDVFRIFFSESFVIAMINFILSFIGTLVVVIALNSTFRTEYGLLITILNMGIRQVLLLFVVSLLIAFVASYLPVKKIASKKPIDAIRNR